MFGLLISQIIRRLESKNTSVKFISKEDASVSLRHHPLYVCVSIQRDVSKRNDLPPKFSRNLLSRRVTGSGKSMYGPTLPC